MITLMRLIIAILPLALLPLILIGYHAKKALVPAAERVDVDPEGMKKLNEWMMEAGKTCEEFRLAESQPEWDRIRGEYKEYLKGVEVVGVRGTLVHADGPTYCRDCAVFVSIKAGDATLHSQESVKGTKVYKQAQEIEEGDCVVFSGTSIEPASSTSFTDFDPCYKSFGIELTELNRCR